MFFMLFLRAFFSLSMGFLVLKIPPGDSFGVFIVSFTDRIQSFFGVCDFDPYGDVSKMFI